MINLAVFRGKDIIKYLIKFVLITVILILGVKLSKVTKEEKKISRITEYTFIGCLDDNIPGLSQMNDKKDYEFKEIEPLKVALKLELDMIDTLILKENKNDNEKEGESTQKEQIKHADTGLSTNIIESNVPNKFTNDYNGVQVKNETEYNLTEEILKPDVTINNKNILIFHTHTCESYTATEKFNYTQTGTYRTTDLEYNVVRVGTELTNQMKSYNYNVIHDKTYHDYPAYNGSYGRSLETVKKLLEENNGTDIVLDIHRDAIGDYTYAPTVKIGEDYAARLMFVIGTDGGGLEHKNWQDNLKFAVKIQEKANELYPGLFKPIILRNSRYNQHLAKGASIIEVGATGNTMEQCLNSMKYLAKVLDEVIK